MLVEEVVQTGFFFATKSVSQTGELYCEFWLQAGGSPDRDADEHLNTIDFHWNGQAEYDPGLLQAPTGNATPGTVGSVIHQIGVGGVAHVVVNSPVAPDDFTITIIQGDDYFDADDRALEFLQASQNWPVLTDALIELKANFKVYPTELGPITGSVVTGTGDSKLVIVELDSATTSVLPPGTYKYDLQATLDGTDHIITLVRGSMNVLKSYTSPPSD